MTFKMELNVIITLVFIYCVAMKLRLKKTKDKREIALKAAALPMVTKYPCTNTSKDPVIVAKDGKKRAGDAFVGRFLSQLVQRESPG